MASILIVDDELEITATFSRFFERSRHEVHVALEDEDLGVGIVEA